MDMELGGLRKLVMQRGAWSAAIHKELDMTEQLNWPELIHVRLTFSSQESQLPKISVAQNTPIKKF